MFKYYCDNLGAIYAVCQMGYFKLMPMAIKESNSIELGNLHGEPFAKTDDMTEISEDTFFEVFNKKLHVHECFLSPLLAVHQQIWNDKHYYYDPDIT